jgi:proteic killer suppression protein
MKTTSIELSKQAIKNLSKMPSEIIDALELWIRTVKSIGINETRKIKGYHDEPLKGVRKGQRSIRLNRAYRAIYVINENDKIEIVIIEVNKHKY